jgi:hypothetical protein
MGQVLNKIRMLFGYYSPVMWGEMKNKFFADTSTACIMEVHFDTNVSYN